MMVQVNESFVIDLDDVNSIRCHKNKLLFTLPTDDPIHKSVLEAEFADQEAAQKRLHEICDKHEEIVQ